MHATTSYRVHLLRPIVDSLSAITEANLCIVIHSFTPLLHEFYAERALDTGRAVGPSGVGFLAGSVLVVWLGLSLTNGSPGLPLYRPYIYIYIYIYTNKNACALLQI